MDRMTQDGAMHEHLNRECWGARAQDAPPEGPWLQAFDSSTAPAGADARLTWLLRTIEAEIIPRLMLAHQTMPLRLQAGELMPPTIGHEDVAAFAALALTQQAGAVVAHVEGLRAAGMALDTVYLDLLAPAARHLGELWEADLCDFTQVTLGLWRLQQAMHELSPSFHNEPAFPVQQRRVLLAPAPGSQHTLGLFMVAEFFRRAGWEVWAESATALADVASAVRAEWFDVVGLSVGVDAQIEAVSSAIVAVRKASRNASVGVMVGGALFASRPELVAVVGADATAADAPQAVVQAENLMALRERRC